jgi:NhaP-type Na+/H+ or K+/H+ antiporter
MSDQWPTHHPAPVPGPPSGYGLPQVPQLGAGYRRWAGVLLWGAIVLAGLMVVAFVVSLVFLTKADASGGNASYGYLALFLWFGIAGAIPVLLALGIPGLVMTRRVRRQRQPWAGHRA